MKGSFDQLTEARQLGSAAEAVLDAARPVLDRRERQIINEAIAAFRGGTLDPIRALGYVAALSELSAFGEEMEHRIRQGQRAAEELVTKK